MWECVCEILQAVNDQATSAPMVLQESICSTCLRNFVLNLGP